jgi:hypothetical protein
MPSAAGNKQRCEDGDYYAKFLKHGLISAGEFNALAIDCRHLEKILVERNLQDKYKYSYNNLTIRVKQERSI